MSLINCEINAMLTWYSNWVFHQNWSSIICNIRNKALRSVVILPTQDNANLLQQGHLLNENLIAINTKSKSLTKTQNWFLDFLIKSSFQGVNRLFVL